MANRLELHDVFINILGTREQEESRVYFQPPASIRMKYPAIVYGLSDIENSFANDGVYLSSRQYSVIVIDDDPDSPIIDKVAFIPTCQLERVYKSDNLNHFVFNLYF